MKYNVRIYFKSGNNITLSTCYSPEEIRAKILNKDTGIWRFQIPYMNFEEIEAIVCKEVKDDGHEELD